MKTRLTFWTSALVLFCLSQSAFAEVTYVEPGYNFIDVQCGTTTKLGMFINPGTASLEASGSPWIGVTKEMKAAANAAKACEQNVNNATAEIVRLSLQFNQLCIARQCTPQVIATNTASCETGTSTSIGGQTAFMDADGMANVAFGNDCTSPITRVPGDPYPTVNYNPSAEYCNNHFDDGGVVWGGGHAAFACSFGGGTYFADFVCE